MSDQFVAEIRIFGFTFPPTGWAYCNGQLLPISQNTALFSLLGTYYGGDGRSTFALPNMQGNVAICYGQSPGLSLYEIGETGGSQTATLLSTNVPAHSHTFQASSRPATSSSPSGNALAKTSDDAPIYAPFSEAHGQLNPAFLSSVGGSQPHNNLMPYLAMYWIIALQGVFPPRS